MGLCRGCSDLWVPWTGFTLQQSSSVTFATEVAHWFRYGDLVFVEFAIEMTSTGSAGTAINFPTLGNLPARLAAASNRVCVGEFRYTPAAGTPRSGVILLGTGSDTIRFGVDNANDQFGNAPSVGLAVGDVLAGCLQVFAS